MDSKWPRASQWLREGNQGQIGLLGVPAHQTSLSPTSAHLTPAAVRNALARYSTYTIEFDRDLRDLDLVDLGDISDPDADDEATTAGVLAAASKVDLLIALGGDNSITYSVARGAQADAVITFDAHHDVRDGRSNGSPIKRLIESGVSGNRIVQIGITDFANSAEYSRWAREQGVHVITRSAVAEMGMSTCIVDALNAIEGATTIHVDVDVDVCDRSVAPACPASVPGGLSAAELRAGVRMLVRDRRVKSVDITEIDASADAPDERTIRLGALIVLESALGYSLR